MVSIIVPVYNEQDIIRQTLESLAALQGDFEVLVSDGSSIDLTASRVTELRPYLSYPLRLVLSPRHRALQLNRASELARGDVLLFLHADARLDARALAAMNEALRPKEVVGGNFALHFEGDSCWSRAFTRVNNARRRFGIYYGDSAIFVRREVFHRLGGFKLIPIMDDYEFVRRLERCGRTVCLAPAVGVSDRRWRMQGVLRTLWTWFWIQALYSVGVSPDRLARWYRPVRERARDQQPAHGRRSTGIEPLTCPDLIPDLEEAAKFAPDSPQAHYALSEAYMRANRRQDAYRQRAEFARLKNQQSAQPTR